MSELACVIPIRTQDPTDVEEDAIIAHALSILERRMRRSGVLLNSPEVVSAWLRLKVGSLPHEEFGCIWLTSQNEIIEAEQIFRGTLTQTSVYPRELVKLAILHNSDAVILYHNHPAGCAQPSAADIALTRAVRQALAMVDVRVLDHLVVTAEECVSFAKIGLL